MSGLFLVRIQIIVFLLLAGLSVSEGTNDLELRTIQKSPRGDILIKTYWDRAAEKNHVWLESATDSSRKALLYTYARSGSVVISPNEEMIAFNHNYASTDSTIVLFRKVDEVHYRPLECNVETIVWRLFKSTYAIKDTDLLDHTYVECLGWSRDASAMLIKAYGHGNGRTLDAWYCVVDVNSCTSSTDLTLINRKAFDK